MSIFNNFLKKTEEKNEPQADPAAPAKNPAQETGTPLTSYVRYGLWLCLGIAVASILFVVLNHAAPVRRTPGGKALRSGIAPKAAIPSPAPANQQPVVEKKSPEEAVAEPSAFVLNGLFSSSEGNFALINNQIVKVGDTLLDAKVVRITPEGAELEQNGKLVTLTTRKK